MRLDYIPQLLGLDRAIVGGGRGTVRDAGFLVRVVRIARLVRLLPRILLRGRETRGDRQQRAVADAGESRRVLREIDDDLPHLHPV